jgi:ornithine carbamoyltransferase
MRHLLTMLDLTPAELLEVLAESVALKKNLMDGKRPPLLAGRILGLVFEKPSLRTRASFESAIQQLGGSSIFLSASDGAIGVRESVADFARTFSQFTDAVVLRTFKHCTVEEFAAHSSVPVINGLSDRSHPCQALGDLLTVQEAFGGLTGRTLVFVGDGNNVSRSLAAACAMTGMRFILAGPNGYGLEPAFLDRCKGMNGGSEVVQTTDVMAAVAQADVIYTDVWTSMGQEAEREERKKRFAGYQVNAEMLKHAPARARVMHCLPAIRGEEITEEVIDGPQSLVFPQAGNRLHIQKGLLKWLLAH